MTNEQQDPPRDMRGGFAASWTRVLYFLERRLSSGWRYAVVMLLDAAVVCASFYLSYLLRLDGHIPPDHMAVFWLTLPMLLAIRLPLNLAAGLHRWSFRFSGFHEAVRLVQTSALGTLSFLTLFFFLRHPGPPRSVIVLEFFMTTSAMGALRFSPRLAHKWLLDRRRSTGSGRVVALIVGAGSAGELLIRDLNRSDEHPYRVAGFVDDNPAKHGTYIGGRPVLGPISSLPGLVRRRGIETLLFAIPRLEASRIRAILTSCADLKLNYKILPVSFTYLNDRVSATMLHDLAPDDLLPRHKVAFDSDEMRRLIAGRRILVTGAAGSIGSEICRQAASYGPAALILADINENDLYFLYRHLRQKYPGVAVAAEVVDIRDRTRLLDLGRCYHPQDVFHAAAHKHVPLMEYAPEEAIKNNVSGCRNVADMAEDVGVERFVLISTDKAVKPSSVMGATKRIQELIVRERAERSSTAYSTVRFGNVLGSAGSVVPLFKAQIAEGGPVTVTHPECRRFVMTISEAVGLVLLAGLGGHGDLCILEMGEPIHILDLARLMITMTGLVPDVDVPIEFTGLRPGEKLDEQLMTDEESQRSRSVREMIRVVSTSRPPQDLLDRIARLEATAWSGDRAGVIAQLGSVVPEYCPSPPGNGGQGPVALSPRVH